MKSLRSIWGYFQATTVLPIILITFVGLDFWAESLVAITGLKVSPWYTGGEVIQTINHGSYHTLIHEQVFKGLLWERRKGFIQVAWKTDEKNLPELIEEEFDYDRNGAVDFRIKLNTKTNNANLVPYNQYVLSLTDFYDLKNEKIVRVALKNSNK